MLRMKVCRQRISEVIGKKSGKLNTMCLLRLMTLRIHGNVLVFLLEVLTFRLGRQNTCKRKTTIANSSKIPMKGANKKPSKEEKLFAIS